jgi:hypothetical protein
MDEGDEVAADRAGVLVPAVGAVVATEDPWEPYRLVDANGACVGAVAEFLKDLQAAGCPATTQRSYGMALLRWFPFLGAQGIKWDQATRVEARDFCRWLALATKPRCGVRVGRRCGSAQVPRMR